MSWLHFQGASTSISRRNRHYFSHDRATIFATIAPRLGRDRGSIMLLELRRSLADRRETISLQSRAIFASIAARSRRDRGSIATRSWSSSSIVQRRPITPQVNEWLRSRDCVVTDFDECPPSDPVDRGDDHDRNVLRLMKIQRSRVVHVAQGRPCDYVTYYLFLSTCLIWRSRGLGSTRSPPL